MPRNRYADLLDDGTPEAPYGGVTGGRANLNLLPPGTMQPTAVPTTAPAATSGLNVPAGSPGLINSPIDWNAAHTEGVSYVPGPQGGDYQSWFMNLVGDRPWNQQTLNALMPTLQHYGFNLTPANAAGEQTKIQLPTGEWIRVGFGEGHPVWIPQTDAQGRSLFGPSSGNTGISGFGGGNMGGNYWSALAGELGGPPPFELPTLEQLQATPGYQARLDAGQQALERGAAAKGTVLSGGFQKALNRYAQDYASNEYNNLYGQYLQRYNTNVGTQSVLPWNRYADLLGVGQNATNLLGQAGKVPLGAY